METKIIKVTPAMAREWLKANIDNRPLRRRVVDSLHDSWMGGEWKVTHQGVAFDEDGVLRDGQHRLTFISELPAGTQVPIMVTRGMGRDTFGAIDVGARRTPSDELKISVSLSAVAAFMASLYNGNQKLGYSLPYLKVFVDFVQPYFSELHTFCPSSRKTWSSAPVMSAAIIQMARGHNEDFVKTVYRSLVLAELDAMTPTALALVKQQLSGKIAGARSYDLFCRSLRAFDSMAPAVTKIQIKSITDVTADVREFLQTQVSVRRLKKTDPRKGGSKAMKTEADLTAAAA